MKEFKLYGIYDTREQKLLLDDKFIGSKPGTLKTRATRHLNYGCYFLPGVLENDYLRPNELKKGYFQYSYEQN